MRYIRVEWRHLSAEYPVVLYSELDAERYEVRKVEVFADGRYGYASAAETAGDTRLGVEPVALLEQIAADPEFVPREITREEFERVWTDRLS